MTSTATIVHGGAAAARVALNGMDTMTAWRVNHLIGLETYS